MGRVPIVREFGIVDAPWRAVLPRAPWRAEIDAHQRVDSARPILRAPIALGPRLPGGRSIVRRAPADSSWPAHV